jgi:hypothetical protein
MYAGMLQFEMMVCGTIIHGKEFDTVKSYVDIAEARLTEAKAELARVKKI